VEEQRRPAVGQDACEKGPLPVGNEDAALHRNVQEPSRHPAVDGVENAADQDPQVPPREGEPRRVLERFAEEVLPRARVEQVVAGEDEDRAVRGDVVDERGAEGGGVENLPDGDPLRG